MAHRGWMNFARQLLHSYWLRRCQRRHLPVAAGYVVANRGQASQNRLPLCPVELPQEWPQPLDEWILQQCFAVRFGNEEAVQANAKRFGNFLKYSEAGRLLSAFDSRQIRPGYSRTFLEVGLRHPAQFAQLPDALPDILQRLVVRPLLKALPFVPRKLLRLRRRNKKFHLRRQQMKAPAAISGAGEILHHPAGDATDYVAVGLYFYRAVIFIRASLLQHRCYGFYIHRYTPFSTLPTVASPLTI